MIDMPIDVHPLFSDHIEILGIIKDKLNQIPDETIEWDKGELENAQFVFLQYLKVVIDEESDKWINLYVVDWLLCYPNTKDNAQFVMSREIATMIFSL